MLDLANLGVLGLHHKLCIPRFSKRKICDLFFHMDFVCLKHVCENGWNFSSYLYIYLYVLNAWHMCAKIMNLWKMNSTRFPLPNPSHHEMQSLWNRSKAGLVTSLVPSMTIKVDSHLWSTQPTLFWSHILHYYYFFKRTWRLQKQGLLAYLFFFSFYQNLQALHTQQNENENHI